MYDLLLAVPSIIKSLHTHVHVCLIMYALLLAVSSIMIIKVCMYMCTLNCWYTE